jgi:uncharacterized repeat protein (TIGR01451 family)
MLRGLKLNSRLKPALGLTLLILACWGSLLASGPRRGMFLPHLYAAGAAEWREDVNSSGPFVPVGFSRAPRAVAGLPAGLSAAFLTGSLNNPRYLHTATLLNDGRVLVAGGNDGLKTLDTAELYDPATNSWSLATNMISSRESHTATLLSNGKVLVVGGSTSNRAEVYDPTTNTWTQTGMVSSSRFYHTATLIGSGKVLVAGGANANFTTYYNTGELYDPATNSWSSGGTMNGARSTHTATLLANGKVLAAGGFDSITLLNTADVYNPATNTWTSTAGNMQTARFYHTSTLLQNGKVLIAGGFDESNLFSSAELFDPATGLWSFTGSLNTARDLHTATLLPSGLVLVTGGYDGSGFATAATEVYNPTGGNWATVAALNTERTYHTVNLLGSGRILLAGGFDGADNLLGATELYSLSDLSVTKSSSPATVIAGNNLTYALTLNNAGPSQAQSVTLTDAVPAGTTFVSATIVTGSEWAISSQPAAGGTGNVVFSKSAVASGEAASFQVVVKVAPATSNGSTITNNAVAATTTPESSATNNTGSAASTVIVQSDLSITKTDSPDPVFAGNNLTYTLSFSNNGPSNSQNVTITDGVPSNTTFVSASVVTGSGWAITSQPMAGGTGNVVFSKSVVASNETATFQIVVNVNPSAAQNTTITNNAVVSGTTADPVSGNNTSTATTLVSKRADLELTKSDSPDPVVAGSNLTYTLNFRNIGPDSAQTVSVTDAVPANTTFVSAAVSSGTGWATTQPAAGSTGTNVIFSKTSVAADETAVFEVVVKVNPAAAQGSTITNTATASSTTTDPVSTNNTATALTNVNRQADMAVTSKTDSPDPVIAGNNLTYTITLSNAGPSQAQSVTLTDAVPAGTTFVSASMLTGTGWAISSQPAAGGTGNVVFSKSAVASGETASFQVVVKVNPSSVTGTVVSNTATAASATADPDSNNNAASATTTVEAQADLVITKSDSPDPAVTGFNITYTITVTNNGPSTANTITLADTLPALTSFVSCSSTGGGTCGGSGNDRTVSFASLASGASATVTLTARLSCSASHGESISNTATVNSSTPDPNVANNSASTTTTASNVTSITPTANSFAADGGNGTVSVTVPDSCGWTAISNDSWITVTSGATSAGNGTVSYSVSNNNLSVPRSGTITVAGKTFTVSQAAASNRVFVSAKKGSDANNCSPTSPCRNFTRALNMVAAGGEIIVLDSGGYGATMTINKSVIINAPVGVHAGLAVTSGSGIIINAGPSDIVVLRGLTVNGAGGVHGIDYIGGGALHVENCVVNGFAGYGINFVAAGQLFVKDTLVRNSAGGLFIQSSAGAASASVDRCRFENNSDSGVQVGDNAAATIRQSVVANGGYGFIARAINGGALAELNLEGCTVTNNGTGIMAGGGAGTSVIRVSNSSVTGNGRGLIADVNGSLLSRGNNTVEGNAPGGDGVFTGTILGK